MRNGVGVAPSRGPTRSGDSVCGRPDLRGKIGAGGGSAVSLAAGVSAVVGVGTAGDGVATGFGAGRVRGAAVTAGAGLGVGAASVVTGAGFSADVVAGFGAAAGTGAAGVSAGAAGAGAATGAFWNVLAACLWPELYAAIAWLRTSSAG